MTSPLYYEDFQVGQRFTSAALTVDRDQVIAFARDYDPQPQHLDEESARNSLFGRLVASGWQTAALSMRLQLEAVMHRIPGGAMGAQIDTLAWRRPVYPGDRLHVIVEVREMRPSRSRPDRGLLTMHTTTRNQDGETVLDMTAAILVPRRPAET